MHLFPRDLPAAPRAALALCLAATLAGAAAAAPATERSKQKAAAEAQRAELQHKLAALKRDISQTESAKDDAADTLAESEAAISNANRALRDLAAEQGQTGARLRQLAQEHERLAATVARQKKQLADLLRQQYLAGNEDRIKLLLSGDNPNRINRDLQMMGYVSQAQAQLLGHLRGNLQAVEANQEHTRNARDELAEIVAEQRQQKAVLEQEKGRRAALLGTLAKRLAAQRQEAGHLERDDQRLGGLVDQLGKLIKEQAAAAAQEQRRQQQLAALRAAATAELDARQRARAQAEAKARAEAERLARDKGRPAPGKPPAPFKPTPIDADEAPLAQQAPALSAPARGEPARPADVALAPVVPDGQFASLQGRLHAPVAGRLAAKFGGKRGDGPSWKGVFIRAAEGAEVKAVAAGRVVFAEWLRGFGNLVIVDHGSQYMTIYGNNQTLLKRVGEVVKAGEAIASAGNSGGNEESGLYFEMRHQGRAFDPAGWVRF